MREIESWLSYNECSYLVTETISIADLAVFHELTNAFKFCSQNKETPFGTAKHFDEEEFPLLASWMDDIESM